MHTIGRLAKRHGLSRSTLLYYDRIGLLRPSGHARGEYRHYTTEEDRRLARICEYRKAGLTLGSIARILDDQAGTGMACALERRLAELNAEMDELRSQQSLVAGLLGRTELLAEREAMDKATWVSLLQAAGFSEEDMRRWHIQFERSAPDKHDMFLRQLNIPEDEISAIRAMTAAPRRIQLINKDSGKFMEVFFRIYEGLDREGPGSRAMMQRALQLCQGVPEAPAILEVGCGTGGTTLDLATLTDGTIVAADIYQPYLDRLVEKAEEHRVADRITAIKQDMAVLDLEPEHFDLIWCEGATHIMGVDKALECWKQYLKPGGCLVINDAVWLTDTPPRDVKEFWDAAYPAMRTAEGNTKVGKALGYTVLGHFTIDTECRDAFYTDAERLLNSIEDAYANTPDGRSVIDITRHGIALSRRYPGMYGYAVHVFRK